MWNLFWHIHTIEHTQMLSEMNGGNEIAYKMCLCTERITLPITTTSTEEFLESFEA
jgi:hypothetical protein